MPGIIESEEPTRTDRIEASVVRQSAKPAALSDLDVERLVDRLRFMGLNHELVDEADHRLRSDSPAGLDWLRKRLKELQPPDQSVECNCGEPLLDPSWRGRATVRCSVCGSRWGVEVVGADESSQWVISDPSEQYLAAHRVEEVIEDEFDPADVLIEGLPALPADGIPPGGYFPLAMWSDGRSGAVLFLRRLSAGEFRLPGEEYEEEIEHLRYDTHEGWQSTGSGGGNWVNVFDPPADLLDKYVVFATGISGTSTSDHHTSFVGGLCGLAVAAVQTVDHEGVQTYPISKDRPFFLVGINDPPGVVRFLDERGSLVSGPDGSPIQLQVH